MRKRTVRRGVREEEGPKGGCRESIGELSHLVELRDIYKA